MKPYEWNPDKNDQLRKAQGIGFEDIVFHIEAGDLINTIEHPNRERYPHQQILVVVVESYIYLVPFVETESIVFLKTIIPSRKATKHYLGKSHET